MQSSPMHLSASLRFCKLVWTAILCFAWAAPALSQQPLTTLLVDVDHRASMSLNGDWHYLVDPGAVGLFSGAGKLRDDGYASNRHPIIVGERTGYSEEYDFQHAPTLKVPGDWNTQDPNLFRYEGCTLVPTRLYLPAEASYENLSAYRGCKLSLIRVGEHKEDLPARRGIYSFRLRGNSSTQTWQQLRCHCRRLHPSGGRYTKRACRLVQLWRHYP